VSAGLVFPMEASRNTVAKSGRESSAQTRPPHCCSQRVAVNHQHIPISSLLATEFLGDILGGDVASRRSLGPLSLGSLRSTMWNSVFAHPSASPVSRGFCLGNRVNVFESRVWVKVPPHWEGQLGAPCPSKGKLTHKSKASHLFGEPNISGENC
jgi:hypothetical protein